MSWIKQQFNKAKLITLGAVVGILILILYPYYRDYKKLKNDRIDAPVLTEKEKAKVIVNKDGDVREVVRDKKGNQKVKVTPGSRGTTIIVDNDGNIKVHIKSKGFIFEPGITSFLSDGCIHVGIDTQWFYYRRWGVGSGLGMAVNKDYKFSLYTGVYYNFWSNTSLHVGLNEDLNMTGGVRVKF